MIRIVMCAVAGYLAYALPALLEPKRPAVAAIEVEPANTAFLDEFVPEFAPPVEQSPALFGKWAESVEKLGPNVAAKWQPTIRKTLAHVGSEQPFERIVGIMLTESMGKAGAENASKAAGLLGVKPIVCAELKVADCDLQNPRVNIALGIRYLDHLEKKYGYKDEELLLAYSVGPSRARELLGTDEAQSFEYIRRVQYAAYVIGRSGS